jgi:hypothetical protein
MPSISAELWALSENSPKTLLLRLALKLSDFYLLFLFCGKPAQQKSHRAGGFYLGCRNQK